MALVADYVARFPGQTVHSVSRACGPHGSSAYGRAAILRAVSAGLVSLAPHPTRRDWRIVIPN